MKKNYIFSLLFVFAAGLHGFAQMRIAGSTVVVPAEYKGKFPSVMVIDTLEPPSFGAPFMCDTAFRCYDFDYATPVDTGYVFGNSKYNGTECAQKYYAAGTVTEVLVMYGHKRGTTGITFARIYSVNPATKKPLTVLGSSTVVTLATISTSAYTSYIFSSPVTVTGVFAAGVVFPNGAGDTVGVSSTKIYCSTTDTLSFINFPSLGGWMTCPFAYSVPYDPTANLDLLIKPVMNVTATGMTTPAGAYGLSMMGAYPNPAADKTTIRYELQEGTTVSVEIFDLSGRVLLNVEEHKAKGEHALDVNVKDLAAGNYYYTIHTGRDQFTGKFSVTK